jgi:hypothetical protein
VAAATSNGNEVKASSRRSERKRKRKRKGYVCNGRRGFPSRAPGRAPSKRPKLRYGAVRAPHGRAAVLTLPGTRSSQSIAASRRRCPHRGR